MLNIAQVIYVAIISFFGASFFVQYVLKFGGNR